MSATRSTLPQAAIAPAATPPEAAASPTLEAAGGEVCRVPRDVLPEAVAVRDWLLEGAIGHDHQELLTGFAERLDRLGVPVERLTTAIDALHSEYSGIGRIWTKGEGSSFRLFPHGAATDEVFARSPFALVQRTGEWLDLDLDQTAEDAFGIVPELKAAGYRQYLVIPLRFTNGTQNGITLATSRPGGFDARAIALLRFVVPTLAAAIEMRSVHQRLDNVLRIYVGDEPHRAILSGAIRRGQVSRIRSAILFADMRSYTRLTSLLSPEAAVDLLNGYFDCLVPAIEQEGGEVLKYMGDGVLAIFRDRGDDTGGSAQAALNAAIAGLVALDDANRDGRFPVRIEAGIALHHGEAAYGNVGSGNRLDFTVIGPDVNLASRIARLNKVLGEPLLMSRAFADHLWGDPEPLGAHEIEGLDGKVPVYRLRRDPA
ncbi:adenylate/guanylate cyclase domain-containing protein [Enterovirga sp.]|jgi:adenylate cyclase|uniref:adenylate/guanylate cyclase domain-containing protein n=1 Tax=Enterovirga sp. TaxID=2026350 RepID=UPI002631F4F0|nr:adenylate/guanylate cyclase domain-containing protein [Enterovirga sp.]MDB5589538.1 adenylate/guanylate cyclase [Enterovirga sp.]